MKINLFDVIFCIFMRYKYTILCVILSIFLAFFTSINNIIFIPFCICMLILNYLCNSSMLFNEVKYKSGYFKKKMYNKYKDILNFKCTLIYDQNNLRYNYIRFDDIDYYISNIYLFVYKTYKNENFLDYERMRSNNIVIIASSKIEVAERFHECIEIKLRSMNADLMEMQKTIDKYSDFAKEVEYGKYGN